MDRPLTQACKDCGRLLPLTRDHFGSTPSGGFRRQCRSCMRAHVKRYSQDNKSGVKERSQLRLQRQAAAGGSGFTEVDVGRIRHYLQDRCAYCGISLNGGGHVDHMTPVARGGRDEVRNITLCCEPCNLAKHAKTVSEFLRWRLERGLRNRNPRVVPE
jgi:5-methylcytosine-specific restriction endonuclease McrA